MLLCFQLTHISQPHSGLCGHWARVRKTIDPELGLGCVQCQQNASVYTHLDAVDGRVNQATGIFMLQLSDSVDKPVPKMVQLLLMEVS